MIKVLRDKLAWEETLRSIPLGTPVRKNFLNLKRGSHKYEGQVFDIRPSHYLVRYADGDWEEMIKLGLAKWIVKGLEGDIKQASV